MKIFISADIEGVTGITDWEEARKNSSDYKYFAEQMTKEVKAACEGANMSGAKDIVIKDAHGSGRNIIQSMLPQNTSLIRGWSGHPFKMVQGIDESFDAVAFIGYHSYGGSNNNPLAHTINSSLIDYVKINGEYCSEFLMHAFIAAYLGVPVAFLSGDRGICNQAQKSNDNIVTVPVNEGLGSSTINIHPDKAIELIKSGMKEALTGDLKNNMVVLPKSFSLVIRYNFHGNAYKKSFYPGVEQISPKEILFETNDYFEVMRALLFLM